MYFDTVAVQLERGSPEIAVSKPSKPKAFTLREDGERSDWMAQLQAAIPTETKAKAIWRAIREYPAMRAEIERLQRELADARWQRQASENDLARIREAVGTLLEFGWSSDGDKPARPAWIDADGALPGLDDRGNR